MAEQTADLGPIEKYVADNLPVIPTTTAADWFEYSSKHFTGWPTQDNPYDSGQPSGTNNGPAHRQRRGACSCTSSPLPHDKQLTQHKNKQLT